MSDLQEALPNPNASGSEVSPDESVAVDPVSLARHYEQNDVDVRGIVRLGAAILAGAALLALLLWIAMRYWVGHPLPAEVQIPPALVTPPVVRGPGLDADPEVSLDTMLRRQNAWLSSYGWIDREAGVVHIPIDHAMELLVEQPPVAREGGEVDFRLSRSFRMDGSGGTKPAGGGLPVYGGQPAGIISSTGVVTPSTVVTSSDVVTPSGEK